MSICKSFIVIALAFAAAITNANAASHKTPALRKPAATAASAPAHATLFGIALGSPLTVPDCPATIDFGFPVRDAIKQFCLQPQSATSTSEELQERRAYLPSDGNVSYLKYGYVIAKVRNGIVQKILVFTNGVGSQELIMEQLKRKFGKPKVSGKTTESNLMGASFQVDVASWKIGTDEVLFKGTLGRFDTGVIQATSADQQAYETSKDAEQHKGAPNL